MQTEGEQPEGEQGRENPQKHIEPGFEGYKLKKGVQYGSPPEIDFADLASHIVRTTSFVYRSRQRRNQDPAPLYLLEHLWLLLSHDIARIGLWVALPFRLALRLLVMPK
jgi:hypothetical protein